jgi:hypothetical protein
LLLKEYQKKLDNEENKGGAVNSADILFDPPSRFCSSATFSVPMLGSLTKGTITNFTKQLFLED